MREQFVVETFDQRLHQFDIIPTSWASQEQLKIYKGGKRQARVTTTSAVKAQKKILHQKKTQKVKDEKLEQSSIILFTSMDKIKEISLEIVPILTEFWNTAPSG